MPPILNAEDVVRRIAAECTYVDERHGVGIRLKPAAAIVPVRRIRSNLVLSHASASGWTAATLSSASKAIPSGRLASTVARLTSRHGWKKLQKPIMSPAQYRAMSQNRSPTVSSSCSRSATNSSGAFRPRFRSSNTVLLIGELRNSRQGLKARRGWRFRSEAWDGLSLSGFGR